MRKCITTSMIHGAHKATQLLSHEKAGKAYEGSLLLGYCEALYGAHAFESICCLSTSQHIHCR